MLKKSTILIRKITKIKGMKNVFTKIIAFALIFITALSCSSSDDGGSSTGQLATVTTMPAVVETDMTVTVSGTVTDAGDSDILQRGVVWSTSQNPIVDNSPEASDNTNALGEFTFSITDELTPNTTYYVRAFCRNEAGYAYGNQVSFMTGSLIVTNNPKDILTTRAILQGTVNQAPTASRVAGFAYGTSHNPMRDGSSPWTSVTGQSAYELEITGLLPDTVYYVRSYAESESGYVYGAEQELRTVGYVGPGGGYVAYDKGELTDSWRYMEIHPTTLNYNISQASGAAWGNSGLFVSGTSTAIGSGPANTSIIASTVTQGNCGAKLCQNLVLNGKSDWFMGSSDELQLMAQSLRDGGIIISTTMWSSTQTTADYAKQVYYDTFSIFSYLVFDSSWKTQEAHVLPVRRY
jgi:hypothetical protein